MKMVVAVTKLAKQLENNVKDLGEVDWPISNCREKNFNKKTEVLLIGVWYKNT